MSSDSKIPLIRTDSFPHINHRQGRGVYSCSTPYILCQLLHLHICCYRNHSRNIKSRIIRYVWYIFKKLEQLHDLNKMISISLEILNSKLLKDKTSSTFLVTFSFLIAITCVKVATVTGSMQNVKLPSRQLQV